MTRAAATLTRWLLDWRTGVTAIGSVVAVLLLLVVLDARAAREGAIDAARATAVQAIDMREAATRRIDLLSAELDELESSHRSAAAIARLEAEVDALEAQLAELGERPVTAQAHQVGR